VDTFVELVMEEHEYKPVSNQRGPSSAEISQTNW